MNPIIEERGDGTFIVRRHRNPIRQFLWELTEDSHSWIIAFRFNSLEEARDAATKYIRAQSGDRVVRTYL